MVDKDLKNNKETKIVRKFASLIPYLGGFLTESINQSINDQEKKRVYSFLEKINEKIDSQEARLDKEYLKTKDFGYFFEKSIKAAREARNEEKINQIAEIFVNGLQEDNFEESIDMMNTISSLSQTNTLILYRIHEHFDTNKEMNSKTRVTLNGLDSYFSKLPKRIIEKSCNELTAFGLIEPIPGGIIRESGSGSKMYEITDYGVAFCKAIKKKTLNKIGEI